MKIKTIQISALKTKIQNIYRGILIYGPDFGVATETAHQIAQMIIPDYQNNLNVIKITPQNIKEIPSILLDEGNAPTLLGGRKLLWIEEADHTILKAVETYLEYIQTDTFLLICAGNLNKSSALRLFFESGKNVLAVACYQDTEIAVAGFIQDVFRENHIRIQPNVMPLLIERLSENRLTTRQEIDKLITYLGDRKTVEAKDIMQVITDTSNSNIDSFCCAICEGNCVKANKEYQLLLANGENPPTIVRILQNYFNRLLDASGYIEQGESIESAIQKVLKPAQFRLKEPLAAQLRIWKKSYILKVLSLLMDLEITTKQTGMPADLMLDRDLLKIAGVARRHRS